MPAEFTDSSALDGLKHGDSAAADWIVAKYGGALVRYFQAASADPTGADDQAQEVLLRLVRRVRAEGSPPVENLPAFLFATARNLAADVRKAAARRPRTESIAADPDDPARDLPARGETPRDAAIRSERMDLLREAMAGMDDATREILVLRHFDGMTCPRIAEMLGVPEGTVWSRLHRGLDQLRRRLAPGASGDARTAPASPERKRS